MNVPTCSIATCWENNCQDRFLEIEFLGQRVCSFGILIGFAKVPSLGVILTYAGNKVLIVCVQHIQGYGRWKSDIAAAAKSLQSCPTLCDPRDGSPPGSPVPGILQARTLEWLAISFSNAWKWKVKVKSLRLSTWKLNSRVRLLVTPWTAVYQAPLSMGFSRQEYWSGVPLPSPQYLTR